MGYENIKLGVVTNMLSSKIDLSDNTLATLKEAYVKQLKLTLEDRMPSDLKVHYISGSAVVGDQIVIYSKHWNVAKVRIHKDSIVFLVDDAPVEVYNFALFLKANFTDILDQKILRSV